MSNPFDTKEPKAQQEPTNPPSSDNPFDNQLNLIVNDQGQPKYDTVEKALEALVHSQQHIKSLEAENAQHKEENAQNALELEKRKSVQEIIEGMSQPQNIQPSKEDPHKGDNLSKEDVDALIARNLEAQNIKVREGENQAAVFKSLQDSFGDDTSKAIEKVLSEASMTAGDLQALAKTNPAMVLSLFKSVTPVKTNKAVPPNPTNQNQVPEGDLPPPSKKFITEGVSNDNLLDEWRQIQQDVYKKHDIGT